MPQVSPEHRLVFAEAVADLDRYEMLQPELAKNEGVQVRDRQWRSVSGRRAGTRNYTMVIAGGALGLVIGFGLSFTPLPFFLQNAFGMLLLSAIGASAGAYLGTKYVAPVGYTGCMIQLIVNERASAIIPEKVTGQVRTWVPKVLVEWRAYDWRWHRGKPYLWLMLPDGEMIHEKDRSTTDYMTLPSDPYRASDDALYRRRTLNREVSEAGVELADYDAGEDGGDHPLLKFAPYVLAVLIVAAGLIMVVVNVS